MPASVKKRRKAYRPKHVHLPIMPSLRTEFGITLHAALTAAALGYFSKEQFDKIGGTLNCILGALILRPPKDPATLIVIEGAVRAMNQCGDRGSRTAVWTLTDLERAAVRAGTMKAEESLLRLGVFEVKESMDRLKAMQIAEERMTA